MKLGIQLAAGVAALLLVFVLVSYAQPRTVRVECSETIQAAPKDIFAQIENLKNWKKWDAVLQRDPRMRISYSDRTNQAGAWTLWESKTVGDGMVTIIAIEESEKLTHRLELADSDLKSSGVISLVAQDGGAVKVVWEFAGDMGWNPLSRWTTRSLEKRLSSDLAASLLNLKKIVETPAST